MEHVQLGERENRQPLRGESDALSRADVSALNRAAHGASRGDLRPKEIRRQTGVWLEPTPVQHFGHVKLSPTLRSASRSGSLWSAASNRSIGSEKGVKPEWRLDSA